MFYLQVLNWLLLAASGVLALTLSVVCLLFWVYRHEPIMQASFPEVLVHTGIFLGMSLASTLSSLTLYYRKWGYPAWQILLFLCLAATINFYLPG